MLQVGSQKMLDFERILVAGKIVSSPSLPWVGISPHLAWPGPQFVLRCLPPGSMALCVLNFLSQQKVWNHGFSIVLGFFLENIYVGIKTFHL